MLPVRSSRRGSTPVERLCVTLYVSIVLGLVVTMSSLRTDPIAREALRLTGPVKAGFDHPRRWMPDGLRARYKWFLRSTLRRTVNKQVLTRLDRSDALASFERTVHKTFGKPTATVRISPELEARYFEAWREGEAEPVRGFLFVRQRLESDREVQSDQISIEYVDLITQAVFVEADGSAAGSPPWQFSDPFGGRRRGFAAPAGKAPSDFGASADERPAENRK